MSPDQRSDQRCFLYAIPRSAERVKFGKTVHPKSRSSAHRRARRQISLEGTGWELWWEGNGNEEKLLHRHFHESLVDGEREEFWRSPGIDAFLEAMTMKPYVGHGAEEIERCYPTEDWFPWRDPARYEARQMVLVDGFSRAYTPRDAAPGNGHTSLREDYYTPSEHVEASRTALGAIDLDPCSSRLAQQTVRAAKIWTRLENGLVQPWHGRVFMNPPYGDEAPRWVAKLVAEFDAGHVSAAIALLRVGALSGTSWFPPLWRFPFVVLPERVRFVDPLGNQPSPDHGSVFVALGVALPNLAVAFRPLRGQVFAPFVTNEGGY